MEAHFKKMMYRTVEGTIFYSLLKQFSPEYYIICLYLAVVCGMNIVQCVGIAAKILARRMSGEMTTSLGNGLANYCYTRFVGYHNNVSINGVFEGDDGLVTISNQIVLDKMYTDMGAIVKVVRYQKLEHASFCGNIFDPDTMVSITDPIKVVCNFGWFKRRYAASSVRTLMKLTRVKAFSMLYQYPGCPIVGSLAKCLLRLTRSYNLGKIVERYVEGTYERDKLYRATTMDKAEIQAKLNTPVHIKSRITMEEVFGITIQTQLLVERYLDNHTEGPLFFNYLDDIIPQYAIDFFYHYTSYITPNHMMAGESF